MTWNDQKHQLVLHDLKKFKFFSANAENKEKPEKQKSTGVLWNWGKDVPLYLQLQ